MRRKTAASLLPALAAAVAIMGAGVAGNSLGHYVGLAPRIGQIIAFQPSQPSEADSGAQLVALRADGSSCVLDMDMLRHTGGSLVVEGAMPGDESGYLVHWAGRQTSTGATDCGSDAILTVGRRDLDRLTASAGGYATDMVK